MHILFDQELSQGKELVYASEDDNSDFDHCQGQHAVGFVQVRVHDIFFCLSFFFLMPEYCLSYFSDLGPGYISVKGFLR